MRLPTFGLPSPVVPIFYGILLVEAALGAYLSIWPLWMERLGANPAIIGVLLSATGILRVGVVGPSAAIADRFGARRVMLATRWLMLAGYIGAFLATEWVHLLPVIVLMAANEIVFPVAQALVARHSSDAERMRAFTLVFNVGPSAALAAAPVLSAAIVALFGIRYAFLLAAIFTLLAFVAFLGLGRDEPVERSDAAPRSSFRQAITQPVVAILLLLQGSVIFSLSLGIAFIPTFLEQVHHIDASTIALFGAFPAIGSFFFGIGLTRSQRIQREPLLGVAITVAQTIVGLALFHQFGSPAILWLAFFLRGGFFSGWIIFISAIAGASAPLHRARAFAMCEIVGGVTFALGPLLAGVLYESRKQLPFELSILLATLLIVPLLVVQRRVLNRAPDPQS